MKMMILTLTINNTRHTIYQLKILDNGTKAITANLCIQRLKDEPNVVTRQRPIHVMRLEILQGHDGRDLTLDDELTTQVEQSG